MELRKWYIADLLPVFRGFSETSGITPFTGAIPSWSTMKERSFFMMLTIIHNVPVLLVVLDPRSFEVHLLPVEELLSLLKLISH
ncbi:hypothetical protein [Thermocladium modestius]|uniref:hypothetical protein n=1 Tax=Thermocladium modestius TaxID=62609 RepID=UPI00166818E9|nr:hypothetical protein [Thermocladium modestius]